VNVPLNSLSLHLYECKESTNTEGIFTKFGIGEFHNNDDKTKAAATTTTTTTDTLNKICLSAHIWNVTRQIFIG
jgi:hypothetical protein